MKDLIEQLHVAIDNMDDYARMAGVEAVGPLKVLNQAADAIEQLAAALAVKDEALRFYSSGGPAPCSVATTALAIQPHASLVAKIKANAVREAANDMQDQLVISWDAWKKLAQYADRIERGEGK